jgi:hypothetical protein
VVPIRIGVGLAERFRALCRAASSVSSRDDETSASRTRQAAPFGSNSRSVTSASRKARTSRSTCRVRRCFTPVLRLKASMKTVEMM